MKSIDLVREFHQVYDQPINDEPTLDDEATNELRVKLLKEEVHELMIAIENRDPVETLDALTDIQYVLDGAYLSLGFHKFKEAALKEVHRSNLTKLGADGKPVKNAAGKVIKGPNYEPPDIAKVLWQPAVGERVQIIWEDEDPDTGVVMKYPCWHKGVDVYSDRYGRTYFFSLEELKPL